jgi:hypothetical protein
MRPIPDYPYLYARADGTILGPTPKGLRPRRTRVRRGSVVIRIKKGGQLYERSVARLVLEAFTGPCPPGCRATHLDRDPLNNRLPNLAWKIWGAIDPLQKGAIVIRGSGRARPAGKANRSSRRKGKNKGNKGQR